jgi:LemA protein
LVTVENYPELKANQNFIMLQGQLQQIETNIAQERNTFNEVAATTILPFANFRAICLQACLILRRKHTLKSGRADKAPKVSFE